MQQKGKKQEPAQHPEEAENPLRERVNRPCRESNNDNNREQLHPAGSAKREHNQNQAGENLHTGVKSVQNCLCLLV